jgi:phosphatidylglycerophosphatase A
MKNAWDLLLLAAVILALFTVRWLPWRRAHRSAPGLRRGAGNEFIIWIAEGFGVGRIPVGPGTFGSLAGLIWLALLIRLGHPAIFFVGLIAGLAISVVVCGAAERISGKKDPGSVVLDEIVAIPICFIPWFCSEYARLGAMPATDFFLRSRTWWLTLVLFALFRLFDIWKPWPIRPSQKLRGGWGVTADDVLAAVPVALLSLVALHRSP